MGKRNRKMAAGSWLGVTLLELMVALAIVGVLAAVAMPSFVSSVLLARARDMKENVRAEISKARNSALTQHLCVKLTFTNQTDGIESKHETFGACDAKTLLGKVIAGDYTDEVTIETATELGSATATTSRVLQSDEGAKMILLQTSPQVFLFGPTGGTFLESAEDITVQQATTSQTLGTYRVFPVTGIVREL